MAGTLTISTLSDGTNSTSSTNCIQGSAKAWVNFDGSAAVGAQSVRTSYNVSSVTKNGMDDYTVTFTNALTDANYAPVVSSGRGSTWSGSCAMYMSASFTYQAPTTTTLRFTLLTYNASGALNAAMVSLACFR